MKALANIIFPASCMGCGLIVRGGLCIDCLQSQKRISPSPPSRDFEFDEAVQTYAFTGLIRKAIHSLKYKGERSLAEVLALPLINELTTRDSFDAVTWVPAPPHKVLERGFDHAQLLAEAAAIQTGARCIGLLERTRGAIPQMGLALEERKNNVTGLFASWFAPDRVVLIDDVFTTGATASDAARALKERGAEWVLALAVSRTP